MDKSTLSAERARELLSYNPETGDLRWRVAAAKKVYPGKLAGTAPGKGYRRIRIDKVLYCAHRIAWLIGTGNWPKEQVDHIDGNPSNNRLANLRDVSPRVNQQNRRRAEVVSTTGFLGVFPSRDKFVSRIRIEGVPTNLGTFNTPEEAHGAYLVAKREFHAGCTI